MINDLITNLSEYSAWTEAISTFHCNDTSRAREYAILGLLSELGEVCGMLKREVSDPDYTLERLNLKLELGDVLWFFARLHYNHTVEDDSEPTASKMIIEHLGIMLDSYNCLEVSMAIFNNFKEIAKSRSNVTSYILGKSLQEIKSFEDLLSTITDVKNSNSEVADLASATLISMHEMYSMPVGKLIPIIIDNMDGVIGIISFFIMCDRFRFDPYEIMRANVRKLEDRK